MWPMLADEPQDGLLGRGGAAAAAAADGSPPAAGSHLAPVVAGRIPPRPLGTCVLRQQRSLLLGRRAFVRTVPQPPAGR